MSRYDRFSDSEYMAQVIDLTGLVRPQLVEATKRDDNTNISEFRLQPLERGFGHTLGNAMRRMLLSSLRGSAVWGFRIDGVVHEHQTIPGVVEDVHQIIANLKTLTLSLAEDLDEAILRISKSEAGPITAADIQDQSGVRVIDNRHHLFTLQHDRDINVELYVNKGRGYIEADQHVIDRGLPIDLVRIDSIYNPVRRANFSVAETRVGEQSSGDAHRLAELFRTPIDDLELSVRSVNSLKNSNIRSLGDLVRQTESQILQVKNFGKKSLQEIADLLEREGLNFGMRWDENGDGVRITDWGTPPSRAAANAPDDEEE